MTIVSETEFLKNFDLYEAKAQRETVQITCDKDLDLFLISATDFKEYERLRNNSTPSNK